MGWKCCQKWILSKIRNPIHTIYHRNIRAHICLKSGLRWGMPFKLEYGKFTQCQCKCREIVTDIGLCLLKKNCNQNARHEFAVIKRYTNDAFRNWITVLNFIKDWWKSQRTNRRMESVEWAFSYLHNIIFIRCLIGTAIHNKQCLFIIDWP